VVFDCAQGGGGFVQRFSLSDCETNKNKKNHTLLPAGRASSAAALLRSHFAVVSIEEPTADELSLVVRRRFPRLSNIAARLVATFASLQARDQVGPMAVG
jgi:hypothetical protein